MGGNSTIIYASDPHFVVPADRAIRCVHLLQSSGIIGGPLTSSARAEWRPGALVAVQLGIEFANTPGAPGCIRIECHEKPAIYCDPSFSVTCPECGASLYGSGSLDLWSDPATAWFDNPEVEQTVKCSCGAATEISRLTYVGAAITRFAVIIEDAVRPLPDTTRSFWVQLKDALGTEIWTLCVNRP